MWHNLPLPWGQALMITTSQWFPNHEVWLRMLHVSDKDNGSFLPWQGLPDRQTFHVSLSPECVEICWQPCHAWIGSNEYVCFSGIYMFLMISFCPLIGKGHGSAVNVVSVRVCWLHRRKHLNPNIFNRTVHSSTGSPVLCINDVVTARVENETTIENAYDFGSELLKILF